MWRRFRNLWKERKLSHEKKTHPSHSHAVNVRKTYKTKIIKYMKKKHMLRVLSTQNLLLLLLLVRMVVVSSSSPCSCSTKDSVSLDFGTFLTWICQNVLLATRFVYKFSYLNYYLRIQFLFSCFSSNTQHPTPVYWFVEKDSFLYFICCFFSPSSFSLFAFLLIRILPTDLLGFPSVLATRKNERNLFFCLK